MYLDQLYFYTPLILHYLVPLFARKGAGPKNLLSVSCFSRALRVYWVHGELQGDERGENSTLAHSTKSCNLFLYGVQHPANVCHTVTAELRS
jgi:hypothetical protein